MLPVCTPINVRKPLLLGYFQGVKKRKIGLKWVNVEPAGTIIRRLSTETVDIVLTYFRQICRTIQTFIYPLKTSENQGTLG